MEYKKFLYEQKKREKIIKSKSTKVIVKEIRFGPNTDEHDYEFKKKHGIKFLKEGKMTSGHARALVGVKNSDFLARKIIEEGLSVRDIENIVKNGVFQTDDGIKKRTSPKKDVDTLNLEQDIKTALGLKTTIDHNDHSGGGSILIKYKNLEQLDIFCSKIMKI